MRISPCIENLDHYFVGRFQSTEFINNHIVATSCESGRNYLQLFKNYLLLFDCQLY